HFSKSVSSALEAEVASGTGPHKQLGLSREDLILATDRERLDVVALEHTFVRAPVRAAADFDQWCYLKKRRDDKAIVLPLMSAASISARLRRVLHAFWRSVLIAPSVRMWLRIWWRFAYAHFLLQRNPQLVRGGWITLSIRCPGGRRRIRLRDNCWDVLTFYE